MKSFSHFLIELNEGQTNSALSQHLAELFLAVKTHGLAGALKLTIKVVPAQSGTSTADKINVICESQLALPKPKQAADFFFLTDDAEPTRKHPRQHDINPLESQPMNDMSIEDLPSVAEGTTQAAEALQVAATLASLSAITLPPLPDARQLHILADRALMDARSDALLQRDDTKARAFQSRNALIAALQAQAGEVEGLRKALNAMLTHMGMDEDEWNKPTFDQARAALKEAAP